MDINVVKLSVLCNNKTYDTCRTTAVVICNKSSFPLCDKSVIRHVNYLTTSTSCAYYPNRVRQVLLRRVPHQTLLHKQNIVAVFYYITVYKWGIKLYLGAGKVRITTGNYHSFIVNYAIIPVKDININFIWPTLQLPPSL